MFNISNRILHVLLTSSIWFVYHFKSFDYCYCIICACLINRVISWFNKFCESEIWLQLRMPLQHAWYRAFLLAEYSCFEPQIYSLVLLNVQPLPTLVYPGRWDCPCCIYKEQTTCVPTFQSLIYMQWLWNIC